MSAAIRQPAMVAECGCPYDPEYDEGSLGWHLTANHPEADPERLIARAAERAKAGSRFGRHLHVVDERLGQE